METGLPMWTAFTVELPGRATEVVQVVGLQHVMHIPGLLFGDNTPADQLAELAHHQHGEIRRHRGWQGPAVPSSFNVPHLVGHPCDGPRRLEDLSDLGRT